MTLDASLQLTWGFDDPFLTGAPAQSEAVFAQFDCAINGIGFMIDWNDDQLQGPNTIPLLVAQQDSGERSGERSLSRGDLWRRTVSSLHHGAGQRWADRKDSDEFRFRSSKGIDPWTRDRVTLLKDTTLRIASSTVSEIVASADFGSFQGGDPSIYYMDNSVAKKAQFNTDDTVNAGGSGSISGLPGNHPGRFNSLAYDGFNVYVITGLGSNDRLYQITNGLVATLFATAFGGMPLDVVAVAHGRVMVAGYLSGAKIYDATTGTPALAGSMTDIQEEIVDFAEGQKVIYAASRSAPSRQSRVYSISYEPTTATLGSPTVAGLLPMGEQVQTIYGYLGFLFIGTDKGFRMCRQSVSDGSLEVGPLIPITGGVKAFTAVAQFVYFGWSNYDATSSGIGRIDISTFTDADLVPAYASDLMGVVGTVPSLTVFDNGNPASPGPRPYFVVTGAGGGIYQQHATDFVASGMLDTGLVGFDLSEQKDLTAIDVRTEPLNGTIEVQVSPDETSFNSVDVHSSAGTPGMLMPARHIGGSRHELRLVLTRGSATAAPVLSSITLLAYPAVQRGEVWTLPLIVQDDVLDRQGYPQPVDFWTRVFGIRNLAIPGTAPVTVQFGSQSFQAHITDYQTSPIKMNEYGRLQATVRVQLKNMDRSVAA